MQPDYSAEEELIETLRQMLTLPVDPLDSSDLEDTK